MSVNMKCLCGYEKYESFDREKPDKGDEDFIEVDGNFTVDQKYDNYPKETIKVSLYACPKCKTIKVHL